MKKKLSLLLAAMLVISLVPVSSFAVDIKNPTVINVTTADKAKTFTVEYTKDATDQAIETGTLVFELDNGAEFTDKTKVTFAGAVAKDVTGGTAVFVLDAATVTKLNSNAKQVLTAEVNFEDATEGETVSIELAEADKTNVVNFTAKLANVKGEATKDFSIKVEDKATKVSVNGGDLSKVTIQNIPAKTTKLVVSLTNDADFAAVPTVVGIGGTAAATVTKNNDGTLTITTNGATSVIFTGKIASLGRNASFTGIDMDVIAYNGTEELNNTTAQVAEVVDFDITTKVVEKDKKEIPTILSGGKATVKVTVSGVEGSITNGRGYEFTVNGGEVKNVTILGAKGGDVTGKMETGSVLSGNVYEDGEFAIAANNTSKIEFTMEIAADRDATESMTLDVYSRDYEADGIEIAKVDTAFTIETKVTEAKKGETTETADIVITESKVRQLAAGSYVVIELNNKAVFAEKFSIEADNGMTFDKPAFVKNSGDTVLYAKVKTASKGEPATITISDVVVDVESGVNGKIYSASFLTSSAQPAWDKSEDSLTGAKEWTEFDYIKAVAEYSRTSAKIVFTLGSANYTVDGVVKTLEAPVFTKDNRTMLPIGPLALALGLEVNYNADTQTATFRDSYTGQVVSVKENATVLYNNGIEYKMHTAAVTVNGRIFVPVASITDAFGAKIMWDEATQTVTIN